MDVWLGVVRGGGVDKEVESSFYAMVMVRVSVHPAGLGPREAGKAWYSSYFITLCHVGSHTDAYGMTLRMHACL